MKRDHCPMEKQILAAHKKGSLSEEMKDHLATCSICSDSLLVAQWMGMFKKVVQQKKMVVAPLPETDEIWQRAQAANIDFKIKEKRALMPLLIPRILSYLAALAGVFLLLITDLSGLKHFIGKSLGGEQIVDFFTSFFPRFIHSSLFVAIPFFVVILSMAGYFFYSLINPESN